MQCYKLKRPLFPVIFFCFFVVWFYSCQKDNNPSVNNNSGVNNNTKPNNSNPTSDSTYIDSITSSFCNYAGDYINFSFHISGSGSLAIKNIFWNFGDSTTSTNLADVSHIYNNPGTYTATLLVDGKQFTKIMDIVSYPIGSSHTSQMAGPRHWIGSGSGRIYEFNSSSSIPTFAIDTQLTIEVMNDGIIKFPVFNPGITLNLISDDIANKVLTFRSCTTSSIIVQYYYNTDSIIYSDNWSATVGHGYEYFTMHSP